MLQVDTPVALLTLFRNIPIRVQPILVNIPELVRVPKRVEARNSEMGFVIGLIQAVVMMGALALILILVAALFMIVFSLGTMLDKRISGQ